MSNFFFKLEATGEANNQIYMPANRILFNTVVH